MVKNIKADDLKILGRPCRIRWAKCKSTSIDPKFVKMQILGPSGEGTRNSPMMVVHKGVNTIFMRNSRPNQWGVYALTDNLVSIYANVNSGQALWFTLSVCMDYSFANKNDNLREMLTLKPITDETTEIISNEIPRSDDQDRRNDSTPIIEEL